MHFFFNKGVYLHPNVAVFIAKIGQELDTYVEEEAMRARGLKLKSVKNVSSEVSDGFVVVGFKEKPAPLKPL